MQIFQLAACGAQLSPMAMGHILLKSFEVSLDMILLMQSAPLHDNVVPILTRFLMT